MDLRQEKLDDMRRDMLIEQHHEKLMVENCGYFAEKTVEKLNLYEVYEAIRKECAEYGWSEQDIFDFLKEM